jgi:hypothetical protein
MCHGAILEILELCLVEVRRRAERVATAAIYIAAHLFYKILDWRVGRPRTCVTLRVDCV